jgi:hypothetical protein
MSNQIKLLSVSELLAFDFLIPSYQRGYRWSTQQVEELLNDIYGFAIKKKHPESNEFYCLQPIVVKDQQWETPDGPVNGWEVVDGQQRLTTLRILLSYLIRTHLRGASLQEEYGKELFSLTYETRPDSSGVLDHLDEEPVTPDIDLYHMRNAYLVIAAWFSGQSKQRDVREAVMSTLVHDRADQQAQGTVQVIWYSIDAGQDPIDTFIRINLGKIPLTSAELIKALFLQERHFEGDPELGKLRQLEIAGEWDRIERDLQNDDLWWFLNKERNNISSRIEFIFDIICSVALRSDDTLSARIGNDKFTTFRYFNLLFDKISDFNGLKALWALVKDHYMAFQEWFNDPVWYHYVGFLIYCGDDIISVYELTKRETTKEKVTEGLVGRIKHHLRKVKWNEERETPFLDLTYPKHDGLIRRVLLLFNLAPIIDQSKHRTLIYKFPFKAFKAGHWDIEHIDAFSSRGMKDRKDQVAWLSFTMTDLTQILKDDPLLVQVNDFIQGGNTGYTFDYLLEQITERTGEKWDVSESEELKNNIGNLTLLNAHLNRSYGNALFPTKRRKIIEYDAAGDFMPMNTRNVFLKYYDLQGTSRSKWSRTDMESYRNVIASTLKEFLPVLQNPKPVMP